MPGPEETILVAAANLLETEATRRLERARSVLVDPAILAEEALGRVGRDLALAVSAHRASAAIREAMGDLAAEELTG